MKPIHVINFEILLFDAKITKIGRPITSSRLHVIKYGY